MEGRPAESERMAENWHFLSLARLLQYILRPRDGPAGQRKTQGEFPMFALDASNRLFAAAFSVVLSAAFLAYAIVPASPGLVA